MIKNLSSPYQTALAGKAIRNEPDNYAVRPLMKLTTVLSASRKRDSVKSTHARHSLYATPMYEQYFGMRYERREGRDMIKYKNEIRKYNSSNGRFSTRTLYYNLIK